MAYKNFVSESEEMYLVTVARLKEAGCEGPVPLAELAERMGIMPVSANQMIRKLQDAGWVEYTPYRGVDFTPEGEQHALQVLRHHRLWEVFLVERLGIAPSEADSLADRMEHSLPPGTAEKLAAFLGNPVVSPSGHPIPKPEDQSLASPALPLSALKAGETGRIRGLSAPPPARSFLASQGILTGVFLKVLAVGSNGDLLVRTPEANTIHLSAELVDTITIGSMEGK